MTAHAVSRVRREVRRRTVTVSAVERLTPHMVRVAFGSPDLGDFASDAPDDHIKLFFTDAGQGCMRDFTPRAFDPGGARLVVDFALHDAGPATRWAASASIGKTLVIGGPKGSLVVPDDFDWYLLIGDESALPAIGRRVEELRANVAVTTLACVRDATEEQTWQTRARWSPLWVHRKTAGDDDAASLRAALAATTFPAGDGLIWIAAESGVARRVRDYVVFERGHSASWTKAAGYWKRGHADAHERIE